MAFVMMASHVHRKGNAKKNAVHVLCLLYAFLGFEGADCDLERAGQNSWKNSMANQLWGKKC